MVCTLYVSFGKTIIRFSCSRFTERSNRCDEMYYQVYYGGSVRANLLITSDSRLFPLRVYHAYLMNISPQVRSFLEDTRLATVSDHPRANTICRCFRLMNVVYIIDITRWIRHQKLGKLSASDVRFHSYARGSLTGRLWMEGKVLN